MKILESHCVFDAAQVPGQRHTCFCTSFRQMQSGRILASFRLGSTKDSADGNCLVAQSLDQGRTWRVITEGFDRNAAGAEGEAFAKPSDLSTEAIRAKVEAKHAISQRGKTQGFLAQEGEIRACELIELSAGKLAALLLWVDRSAGKSIYNSATDSILPTKIMLSRYNDARGAWGPYSILNTGAMAGPALSGPAVAMPGTGWLAPFENFQPGQGTHSANALFSADGKTFDRVVLIAQDPANRLWFFDERNAWSAARRQPVAMFWTYDRKAEKDMDIHLAWGNPATLTWQAPRATGIRGQVAQPIPLPDGRLLAFYVHRHPPASLRLILSEDDGKTWDHAGELVVYDAGDVKQKGLNGESNYAQYWDDMISNWNFGHPTGVVLDGHTVLLGYYAGTDANCLNVWCARVAI